MANGAYTWFDAALDKIAKNIIRLDTGSFKAVLLNASQALDPTFVGASLDCRYADLTGELATANGYTIGGQALVDTLFQRVAEEVSFTADPLNWTLTGAISFKYVGILCDNANDDLLGFMDANTASGVAVVTPDPGSLIIAPHADGMFGWHRV